MFLLLLSSTLIAGPSTTVSNIHIDQFGYRETAEKIAVISQAQVGYNSPEDFTPGTSYELKRWSDDVTVYSGSVIVWNGGATHVQSGDKAWRFDFSTYVTEGEYYVWDPTNNVGSYKFSIDDDVYNNVLKQAMRTFFYQRFGFAKELPYAEDSWVDAASHMGPEQDTDCRDAKNPVIATSRDLRGGWYDAGDFNKYMNYADETVNNLLAAYEENPTVFADDYNIPESGNGVEDILDEVKYELDWMLRMQEPNGSCIHKVSVTCYCASSPPSTDLNVRRYLAPTISATISGCATYSHAAIIYKNHTNQDMKDYGTELETAAINAWDYIIANQEDIPSDADNTGFVNGAIEDAEYNQRVNLVGAAAYLFALTGDTKYRDHLDSVWNSNYVHLRAWGYAYVFEEQYQDALLYYSELPNATVGVANEIKSRYSGSVSGSGYYKHIQDDDDAYLSYAGDDIYGWGSSRNKSQQGSMYYTMSIHDLDSGNEQGYVNAAENFVHYMHGVNPLNWTYLSNMAAHGAENSITQFYHGWFDDGTDWDEVGVSEYGPPPGFVPGGVNPNYEPHASCSCTGLNQPILKSYKDWNAGYPENSWEITENSITYQAAYIRLLSKFVSDQGSVTIAIKPKSNTEVLRLKIFPNPAMANMMVSGWDDNGTMNITNQAGQIIYSALVTKNEPYVINQSFGSGIYIVHVTTNDGALSGRLVVR